MLLGKQNAYQLKERHLVLASSTYKLKKKTIEKYTYLCFKNL